MKCEPGTEDPGPSDLRLLTRTQYFNTVRALVGDVPGLEAALGSRPDPSEFGLVQADVAQVDVENYQAAADLVAKTIAASKERLDALAPCAQNADERECARSFIRAWGSKAYRTRITEATDVDRHVTLFDAGAGASYAHGIEMLIRGMLQSSRFLYRVELGTAEAVSPTAVKLGAHEVAARLAYTAWDGPPDGELVRAAEAGELATEGGVAAQLERLIQAPAGKGLVRRFLERWIHLEGVARAIKDETLYPEWQSTSLRAAATAQAARFFDYIVDERGGSVDELFTSPTVFVSAALEPYYGPSSGAGFTAVQRTDGTVSGMLTLPALLALKAKPSESSPIYRGKFVREALLCQTLPMPPANIPKPPEVEPGVSTRERLAQHEVDSLCSGCHRLMDPIGFGFEHFDAIGRHRTTDGDRPVDASGELLRTGDIDGAFDGVVELGERLSASAVVEECVAKQWFRYALGRFEQKLDTCSMKTVTDALHAGRSLNALPEAVVRSAAFRYRRPITRVSP